MEKPNVQEGSVIKSEFTELGRISDEFDKAQLDFVKATLAPTLNEMELKLFLYRCAKLGLNPLNGEAFAYASFDTLPDGTKQRKMVFIVARDGKRVIAYRTKHLQSIKTEAIYVIKNSSLVDNGQAKAVEIIDIKRVNGWEGGVLWGAQCTITRDDFSAAFVVTVPLTEYRRENYIWKYKPETMIKKVAASQCLSEAFPELGGVYDESERWDENGNADKPKVLLEDGSKPATEAQKETIKAMCPADYPISETITKQEAADAISQLAKPEVKKNEE